MSTQNTEPSESSPSMGAKTMSAGAATAASQALTMVINTTGTMVIARILDPADFGLLVKVAAVTGIAHVLGDLGLSAATIQREKITQEQLSTLFWVNVAGGVVVAVGVALLGPLLAYFYDDQRVVYVAIGYSVSILLAGLAPQHLAILKRRLEFGRIAITDVSAALTAVVVAILSAPHIGYYALLLQIITTKAVQFAGSSWFSGWVPGRPQRNSGSMSLIKMGSHLTGASFVNYLARNTDNLLIGKIWGEQSLGLYSRAYGLLLLPLQKISAPMSSVAVPALSRLQSNPERYRAFFIRGCSIAMILQVPVTMFAGVAGREIILAMLGPKWVGAIPIFYALVPALLVSSTSPATGWVYLSWGHTHQQFKMTALTSALIVLGFVVSVPFGPIWVAASFSIVSSSIRIPAIAYCFHDTPLKMADFGRTVLVPAVASTLAAIPALLVDQWIALSNPFAALFLKAVIFGCVYLASLATTQAGRSFFHDAKTFVQDRMPRFLGNKRPSLS